MKKAIILLAVVALAGCMTMGMNAGLELDEAYTTEELHNTEPWAFFHSTVWYEGPEFIKQREADRAELELREPNYEGVPDGGYIIVQISSPSIDWADPETLRVVVSDSSGVVARFEGESKVPDPNAADRWYTINLFSVTESLDFPVTVRALSLADPEMYSEWKISESLPVS